MVRYLLVVLGLIALTVGTSFAGTNAILQPIDGGTGATSLPAALGTLPLCTPNSPVAPVPTGQAFICGGVVGGLVMIAE